MSGRVLIGSDGGRSIAKVLVDVDVAGDQRGPSFVRSVRIRDSDDLVALREALERAVREFEESRGLW